jgi:hypothetical protein
LRFLINDYINQTSKPPALLEDGGAQHKDSMCTTWILRRLPYALARFGESVPPGGLHFPWTLQQKDAHK